MKSIRSRAPKSSSSSVRTVMQHNAGRETKPEQHLRSALQKAGVRFRKDFKPEKDLKIKADIVFTRARVCVFVDGCFWHGCPVHFRTPKTNSNWWQEKIEDNRKRDLRQSEALKERGWKVLRIWEHQIVDPSIDAVCAQIITLVAAPLKEQTVRNVSDLSNSSLVPKSTHHNRA